MSAVEEDLHLGSGQEVAVGQGPGAQQDAPIGPQAPAGAARGLGEPAMGVDQIPHRTLVGEGIRGELAVILDQQALPVAGGQAGGGQPGDEPAGERIPARRRQLARIAAHPDHGRAVDGRRRIAGSALQQPAHRRGQRQRIVRPAGRGQAGEPGIADTDQGGIAHRGPPAPGLLTGASMAGCSPRASTCRGARPTTCGNSAAIIGGHPSVPSVKGFPVPTGSVVRFDRRRGYGFVTPDDGGEDIFVHQNNINMEGFRFLQIGERVSFELEVGEKGMKATGVALLEPRVERPRDDFDGGQGGQGGFDRPRFDRGDRGDRGGFDRPRFERKPPMGGRDGGDATRRKLERLVSLLVQKGILTPGELDGVDASAQAAAPAQA